MEFASQRFVDLVVATPRGRIDQAAAEEFRLSLMGALADPRPASLLLDLSGVDYISSVGLRAVMLAARELRARSARIAVASLQPVVREIFEISRFHHVVEVFPSLRDGVTALSPQALSEFDTAFRGPAA